METHKQAEKSGQNSYGQTRKTLLFNERTDRSLNAELSQLERSRKKVKRDLRKIHEVKDLLNTHLLSPSESTEFNARNRSRSEASIVNDLSSGNILPQIDKNNNTTKHDADLRRPRFHSDPVAPVVSHFQKNGSNFVRQQSAHNLSYYDACSDWHEGENEQWAGKLNRPSSKSYKTNQERREDLKIISRFNQLGSKFVGREMIEKRHQMLCQKQHKQRGINRLNSSGKTQIQDKERRTTDDANISETKTRGEINKDGVESRELPIDFSSMKVSVTPPPVNVLNNESLSSFSEEPFLPNRFYTSKGDTTKESQPPKPRRKISGSSLVNGGTIQRKISTGSMGGLDLDTTRHRNEVTLPRIPMELTSNRPSQSSIEHAFMTCQQVNPDDKKLKNERKRRFANLVSAVIKQGKVIKSWEPLLNQVGEIHSSDEEHTL